MKYVAVLILAMMIAISGCDSTPDNLLVSDRSPDGSFTAIVRNTSYRGSDYHFGLSVVDNTTGSIREVFNSPDEAPPGPDVVLWSSNSTSLLVVARKVLVTLGSPMMNDQKLYLMYNVKSGKVFCNSPQQTTFPPFSIDDVLQAGFTNLVLGPFTAEYIDKYIDKKDYNRIP